MYYNIYLYAIDSVVWTAKLPVEGDNGRCLKSC